MFSSSKSFVFIMILSGLGIFSVNGGAIAAENSVTAPNTEQTNDKRQLKVAALGQSSKPGGKGFFARIFSSNDEVESYLIERPEKEGENYVDVVLKAMVDDIDLALERPKLMSKLDKATPGQRTLFAIYLLHNEVRLRGFKSYLTSHASDFRNQAQKGLKQIGANNYLNLLNKSLLLFVDDEEMLETAFDRKNFLSSLSREEKFRTFEEVDSEFEELEYDNLLRGYMRSYINKHPEHFFKEE